jgi:vacuolar protein sorting-associated protein 13A/C
MSQFRRMRRTYAEAYQNKLTSRKISADLQATLDSCEKVMDVFNIVLIRQKIEVEVIENIFF